MLDYKLSEIKEACRKFTHCGKCNFKEFCEEFWSGYTLPDQWEIEQRERTCKTCKYPRGNQITCIDCYRFDKLVDCWGGK